MKTLEEIVYDITTDSSGSFHIEWGEDFEKLSDNEKRIVEDKVYEEIGSCDMCGWHWHIHDMESTKYYEAVCWKCLDDALEEEETEDED